MIKLMPKDEGLILIAALSAIGFISLVVIALVYGAIAA
jgi:hypothetical protein